MADSLRSTTPIDAAGGFAGRRPKQPQDGQQPEQAPRREPEPARAADRVSREPSAHVARQLLRERVLARTRVLLELGETVGLPVFAEVIDGESVDAFLGRLLSAQNQLSARRANAMDSRLVRRCLDVALHEGVDETRELLCGDEPGLAFVAEVMGEYARRLATPS